MGTQVALKVTGGQPTFIRNRDRGNLQVHDLGQVVGATEGAQIFAYFLELKSDTYGLQFTEVPEVELDALKAFFDDEAQGVFTAFDVTIPPHARHFPPKGPVTIANAHFLKGSLTWEETDEGIFSVSFQVFTQQEGPTGPPAQ